MLTRKFVSKWAISWTGRKNCMTRRSMASYWDRRFDVAVLPCGSSWVSSEVASTLERTLQNCESSFSCYLLHPKCPLTPPSSGHSFQLLKGLSPNMHFPDQEQTSSQPPNHNLLPEPVGSNLELIDEIDHLSTDSLWRNSNIAQNFQQIYSASSGTTLFNSSLLLALGNHLDVSHTACLVSAAPLSARYS